MVLLIREAMVGSCPRFLIFGVISLTRKAMKESCSCDVTDQNGHGIEVLVLECDVINDQGSRGSGQVHRRSSQRGGRLCRGFTRHRIILAWSLSSPSRVYFAHLRCRLKSK